MSFLNLQLDQTQQKRLEEMARRRGEGVSQLVMHIIESYLDAATWPSDSEEQWADASIVLASEIFAEEDWANGEPANGPK